MARHAHITKNNKFAISLKDLKKEVSDFFKLGFSPCKAEQPLQGMELQEKGKKGGKKAPTTSFSFVTSTNVGISSQNFLTFSFNPLATLV